VSLRIGTGFLPLLILKSAEESTITNLLGGGAGGRGWIDVLWLGPVLEGSGAATALSLDRAPSCTVIPAPPAPERHAPGSVTQCVEDRPCDQPRGPYAPTTGAGAPHPAQDLSYRAVPSVEGRKVGYGKGALAIAPRRKAIDGEIEAGQLMQRTGEDGSALSTG
jgi:hypothetical protein